MDSSKWKIIEMLLVLFTIILQLLQASLGYNCKTNRNVYDKEALVLFSIFIGTSFPDVFLRQIVYLCHLQADFQRIILRSHFSSKKKPVGLDYN